MKLSHIRWTALRIILALVLVASSVHGQDKEKAIRAIRVRYAAINRGLKHYTKVRRELSGYSSEGGSLEGYFSASSLRKIVATYYGETGNAVEEYYFWNRRLFFVFRKESRYDQPLGSQVLKSPPGTVKSVMESRFYFSNGKLIHWLGANGKQMAVASRAAQQRERELLNKARELIASVRSPARQTNGEPSHFRGFTCTCGSRASMSARSQNAE